mmetsp:Transcript_19761/g.45507  ORF Transcript_19761/g.45507 Transcript_19761/m.45507 type:complete len:206 (+) Transcript_19761:2617-3234(+)
MARGARQRGRAGGGRAQRAHEDLHRHEQPARGVPRLEQLLRLQGGRRVLREARPAPRFHRVQARPVRCRADRRHQPPRPLQAAVQVFGRAAGPRFVGDGAHPREREPPAADRRRRAERAAGDEEPGRRLDDGARLHERGAAERADRAAREDRPSDLRVLRQPQPAEPAHPHRHQGGQDARDGLHQPARQLRGGLDRQHLRGLGAV